VFNSSPALCEGLDALVHFIADTRNGLAIAGGKLGDLSVTMRWMTEDFLGD